jgi:uncharacterized repeat protein (TIGR04076 family)
VSELVATVVSQKGNCSAGHTVGDRFVLGQTTPTGLCSWAFQAMFPFAEVIQFGGSFPWEKTPGTATVACPDADSAVVFRLRLTDAN